MNTYRLTLFLLIFVGCISKSVNGQADTLRIMSFNILHGATTKNDFNLDTISGIINHYDPHLVALQEVDFKTVRAKGYDLSTELGYRTKMTSLFARAMYFDGGEYGEAVLSEYTFVASENFKLPHLPKSEPRSALITRVKTEQGNLIQFVATHLDHQEDNTDRMMQTKALVKKLKDSDYPTLIVGDLNAEPDSEPLKILLEEYTKPDTPNAYVPTWSSKNPSVCIDHILFNMPQKWRVLNYEVLCENYATDHCIVTATLVFTP